MKNLRIAEKRKPPVGHLMPLKVRYVVDSKYRPGRPDELIYSEWKELGKGKKHNVLTATGEALYHAMNFTDATTGVNWIAVTEDLITPLRSHTSLSNEVTDRGCARAQATTRTYNSGTNTTTLTKTFTVSGAGFTNPGIQSSGLMDDPGPPVAGVMGHEAVFPTPSGTLAAADQCAVTWNMTEGP
jgi:hypothetical protein